MLSVIRGLSFPHAPLRPLSFLLFFAVAAFALTLLFMPFSRSLIYTSDDASIILNAQDMAGGNWLLKDWYLCTDSFYTTDLTFYVPAMMLFGFSDNLLSIVPCFLYSLVVLLASMLAGLSPGGFRYQHAFIAFLLLTFFPRPAFDYLLRGPIHVGAIAYALVCIMLLYYEESRPKAFCVLFTAVLATAVVGDSFILYFFALPLLFVQALDFFRGSRLKPSFYATGAAVIIAVGLNKLLKSLGMNVQGLGVVRFVSWQHFDDNLMLFAQGVLQLFNMYFPGEEFSLKTVVKYTANGLILAAAAAGVCRSVLSSDRAARIMATACLLLCVEYLFSSRPEDIMSTRYLLPGFVFALVLAAKNLPFFLDNRRKQWLAAAVLAVTVAGFAAGYAKLPGPGEPAKDDTTPALIAFLEEHGLASGYGPYWSANIVTVRSREKVKVYTLKYDESSKSLRPFRWLSKDEWYRRPANFLIIDEKKPWGGVNLDAALRSFGPPQLYYGGSRYTVLVWGRDISRDLAAGK
jgi:hypothetical protein